MRNAVLITHGTTGSGAQFIRPEFAGELFGAGQPLDATKFFIVLPDGIGHGKSSKPSDGLHAKFPHYGYLDMVEAQYRLLTEGLERESSAARDGHLDGRHAHLAVGRNASRFHGCADAAGESADANFRAQSRLAAHHHRCDSRRSGIGRTAITKRSRRSAYRRETALFHGQQSACSPKGSHPRSAKPDDLLETLTSTSLPTTGDANDVLYAVEASRDYDPGPGLEKIRARCSRSIPPTI